MVVLAVMAAVAAATGAVTVTWVNRQLDEHRPTIDPNDPVAVGVRDAHTTINGAVGWDEWHPERLAGLAPKLRALAARYPPDHPVGAQLADAAKDVDQALATNDRDRATLAHGIVASLERRFAAEYERRKGPS